MSKRTETTQIGRLALRIEGLWWRAYYAMPDTMNGAILLGCIHISCVQKSPKVKAQFMEVMQVTVAEMLENAAGKQVVGWDERTAPEHERAGSA